MSESKNSYNKVLDKLNQSEYDDIIIYVTDLKKQIHEYIQKNKELKQHNIELQKFNAGLADENVKLNQQNKELIEALQNAKGILNTPIARHHFKNEIAKEIIQNVCDICDKYKPYKV